MEKLRDYQQEMLDWLEEAWTEHRSVMVQMPTGTGKTLLLAQAIRNERQRTEGAGHVLIVAHRRELIEQIRRTVLRFMGDGSQLVTVESIQKLSRELASSAETNNSSPKGEAGRGLLVIIDEAHHAVARTYRRLWERWPEARFLGLTATPCRLGGEGFSDLFDVLLQAQPIQRFIEKGWLSDFEYVTAEPDNLMMKQVAGLRKRGADGDYQTREMAMVLDCEESVAHLYETYRQFADGKKGIVYAINIEHARHIASYYHSRGVRCAVIDSKTPSKLREALVKDYRDGQIEVLMNVDIFGEGFDVPEVEFIQLARPTLSLSKYLQQVGRGMRVSLGKECVTILDHVGMYQSFGLPTEDWDWSLMFSGRLAGRAGIGSEGLLYIRGDVQKKELAQLKMMRVKRRNEAHLGLEIYMKDGLYGIAKDGRVLYQPLFEHVEQKDDGYFAHCTYPYRVYMSRKTLIDKEGRDMKLRMYGTLEWDGEVLRGQDINKRMLYWDSKYNAYYAEPPKFVTLAGVEMVHLKDGYALRGLSGLVKPTRKTDIYYNERMIWMKDWLVMKKRVGDKWVLTPFRILAYGFQCFYVKSRDVGMPPVTVVYMEGYIVDYKWALPVENATKTPRWRQIPLTNAQTGRVGLP